MDENQHPSPSEQPLLPFDVPSEDGRSASETDPSDAAPSADGGVDVDAPIAYALTAAGQRAVDPEQLPALRVAPPAWSADDDADDPSDTRPARARALRRAGLPWSAIAAQLGVDELVARAWTEDVPAVGRRRSSRSTAGAGRPSRPSTPSVHAVLAPADAAGSTDGVGAAPDRASEVASGAAAATSKTARDDPQDVGEHLVRAQATQEARQRLAEDPGFAAGVGLLSGLGASEPRAVTFGTADPRVAARVLTWLRRYTDLDDRDVRVVLRLGADVAGDLARHRWATDLGLDGARVAATRTGHTVERDRVHGLVRVVDPTLAAIVAGWCDALLEGPDPALDVAF